MKRFLKLKFLFVIVLLIISSAAIFYFANTRTTKAQSTEDDFSNLIKANNITVCGPDNYLTALQIKGFVNMISLDNDYVINKYNKKLSEEDGMIKLTVNEILELQYYSLSEDDQDQFMKAVTNKKVDVSMADNSVLISYNN